MTEMRWFKSYARRGDGSITQREWGDFVYFTLQYRTKELKFPVSNIADLQNDDYWRWSEWVDVPMVEEKL